MDCTQVLFSESFEEVNSTNEKIPVATLEIEGVFYTIYNSENTIGRDDSCDITIKNNTVSSRHAVIEAEDPTSHLIYDLGSTNKTKLGKITLKPHVRYHIKDGDILTLGNVSTLYNISRQLPSTPEKVQLVESVPETPERGEPSKDVVSESSPEEDKRNLSGLDNSDLDLFDENECDTSVQQELVGSTAGHLDKDNDIYQMDTINFESDDFNPANENRSKEINVASPEKQPSSDENKCVIDVKNIKSDVICDSQNDKESIYDEYTQVCKKTDDEIEACDSTVKGMETDKEIMEVSSSVADIRSNSKEVIENDNDISVYELNTQCDSEVNKEKPKSNNFEWEDFPEIASPLGVDTSNADDLDCTGSSKFQEKPEMIDASGAIGLDITESEKGKPDMDIKGANSLEKLPYDLQEPAAEVVNGECSKEISKDSGSDDEKKSCDDIKNNLQSNEEYFNGELEEEHNDSFLPASQNVDMFDTSTDSKKSFEKKEPIVPHFNESDDDSMYNIATQIFPQNDSRQNKNDESAINDEGASFIFEPATQPTDNHQEMKARASVSRVDETLSASFFEAPTQPMKINHEEAPIVPPASINTDDVEEFKSPNKYLEANISSSNQLKEDSQLLLENKQVCSKTNEHTPEKDIVKDCKPLTVFELATQPFIEPQGKSTTLNTTSTDDNVIQEDKPLDDTCSDPVNDSLSIFDAATQPFIEQQGKSTNLNTTSTADNVIEEDKSLDVIDSPPVNKSLDIFEAATQPVIEHQNKSIIHNSTSSADNVIKDDKLLDVTSSDPINESLGIFEAATQPVIEHQNKSIIHNSTSSADNVIKDDKLLDVTSSDPINESLGIFEAATQPLFEHQGKSTTCDITGAADNASKKDKSPEVTDNTIYDKYTLKDSEIVKNEQKTIENEELPVNESFYEAATQPVTNDIVKDKPAKDPFEDEVMESIVDMDAVFRLQDDSKQFSEELAMSESFYEAETQPIVIDPSKETSASNENICKAHENKGDISDKDKPSSIMNISSSLSISENVLTTDKEPVSEKECDSVPSEKNNLVDNDLNIIDMNEKGENECDKSSNDFTKSFYELATQPASDGKDFHSNESTTGSSLKMEDHDASTIKSNHDTPLPKENEDKNESRKTESGCSQVTNIVAINDMKSDLYLAGSVAILAKDSKDDDKNISDPNLDTLDQDFYNAATQPVSQDNVAVKPNKIDTCTKMSTTLLQAELTDCRSVLMELSESIFTSNVQSCEKNLEKTAEPLLAQEATTEENNSTSKEKIPIKNNEDLNESTSNKTVQNSVDMSISCINFNETCTKGDPKSNVQGVSVPTLKEKVIDSKDHASVEEEIQNPNCNSTQSLLKILMGEDEILSESISQKINNCNKSIEITKNVQELDRPDIVEKLEQTRAPSGNDKLDDKDKEIPSEMQKDINISNVSVSRIKRRSRSVRNKAMPSTSRRNCTRINSDDDSQGCFPVTVLRKKSRVLSISEESEQSSEELIFKFRRRGCNIFPPDTQDILSSGKENVLLTDIETTKAISSTAKCTEEQQKKEENKNNTALKKTNNDESNVIENLKSVPSDEPSEEPTHSNKENTSTIESTDNSLKDGIGNSHSPVLTENSSRDNSSKKHKSPSERDQTYISRGNITLHSQEVLEELEEQFRLAAVSMSPTQLSVASESENEHQEGEAQDSPVARRSERKLKSKAIYKPLVNKNEEQKNCGEEIVNKTHKKSIKNDIVDSEVDRNDSSTSEGKKQPTESDEKITTKSVKKFKKATPIKEKPSVSNVGSFNKSFNSSKDSALDVSKIESPDCSDSQSSFSNNENSESEGLGRGKRKRTKTSFDDFVVDDNFKKQRKKTSSPSLPDSQSLKSDSQNVHSPVSSLASEPREKTVLTQPLSVVLHDINKSSKPSESLAAPSSSGIRKDNNMVCAENDEDDLIIAPKTISLGKTKNLKKKSEDTKMEKKVASESSSKDNTTSFCEKLDELFNIWGPADRVKLSPRVPKKTRKVLENEQNTPSKKKSGTSSPIKNSSNSNKVNSKDNVTSENGKRNSRNNMNNRNKQTNMSTSLPNSSTNSGESTSRKSNNSGRRLPTKHKMNEEDTNEVEGKKPKRNRNSSEAETPTASPVKTMRLTRHNSASLPDTDVKTSKRKRPATKNPKKEDQTLSPDVKSKKKYSAELKNNSQDGYNRKSRPASPNLENLASNNPSCSTATSSKKKTKKSNQELPSKNNNNKSHKYDNSVSPSSEYDMDNFYPMSQEFSFHVKNEEDMKSPMKEEFKPPLLKVRRSARSKNSEKNSQKRNPEKVMFTGISDHMYSALVTKLGGEVVDSPFTCTVLISDKVRRTAKFLSALSRGIPIVTPEWLIKSSNSFADVEKFIISDKEAEKTYAFNLKESLQKARTMKLFDGWSVYITPSVKPPQEEVKSLIECSGGKCLMKEPSRWPPNSLIISCEEDKEQWKSLLKRGKRPPIVGTEALFSGILQQNLDTEQHRLI